MPLKSKTSLACEYAKCKNRHRQFRDCDVCCAPIPVLWEFEMTDNYPIIASSSERKTLTPAAQRALAEAEARRKAADASAVAYQKEFQGPKGLEPTRYGDWERNGIASDF
jgi:hypothetical protein